MHKIMFAESKYGDFKEKNILRQKDLQSFTRVHLVSPLFY